MAPPTTTSQRRRGPLTWGPQTSLLCGLTAQKTAPSPSAYMQRTAKASTGAINCTPPAPVFLPGPRPSTRTFLRPAKTLGLAHHSPRCPPPRLLLMPRTSALLRDCPAPPFASSTPRPPAFPQPPRVPRGPLRRRPRGPGSPFPPLDGPPAKLSPRQPADATPGLCGACFLHGQWAAAWLYDLACGGVLTPVAFSLGPQHLFQLLNTTHCGSPIKSLCS